MFHIINRDKTRLVVKKANRQFSVQVTARTEQEVTCHKEWPPLIALKKLLASLMTPLLLGCTLSLQISVEEMLLFGMNLYNDV